tara:strand:- start:351 stop:488 length:138 start_codon:yes stop_codon:yes gene_type:complete
MHTPQDEDCFVLELIVPDNTATVVAADRVYSLLYVVLVLEDMFNL